MIVDNKDRFYRSAGRFGATLIEVLVSIFIMGIGLMALLVLFPLGALRMAAAIQSERATQAAVAASAIASVKDIRRDPYLFYPAVGIDLYRNPRPGSQPDANPERRSYPLFVDPVGYFTAAGLLPTQNSVGDMAAGSLLLARTNVSFTPFAGPEVRKWFTSQDDIIFEKDGTAKSVVGGAMEREARYSYAFLMQRLRTADPSAVECTVVVYSGRPTGLSGNLNLSEFPYYLYDNASKTAEVAFDPSINSIRVRYPAMFGKTAPPMRAGDWLLDVSVITLADATKDRHAYFNRIAGVTEGSDGQGPYVDYEMQHPLRGFSAATDSGSGAQLLFLEGVAEVFERGLGKEP